MEMNPNYIPKPAQPRLYNKSSGLTTLAGMLLCVNLRRGQILLLPAIDFVGE